jgi:hypothetical protein
MDINITKVEENKIILSNGIKLAPAMLIDNKVIFEGFVRGISEIKKFNKQFESYILNCYRCLTKENFILKILIISIVKRIIGD